MIGQEPQCPRLGDGFGAPLHLEFLEDAAIVPLYRVQGEEEPVSYTHLDVYKRQAQISMITSSGSAVDPAAIASLRVALTELYGLSGSPFEQYLAFWGRLLRGDLGPSLSTFPTPVTELIGRALPWTLALLLSAVIVSWILGNLFGVLRSYYPCLLYTSRCV